MLLASKRQVRVDTLRSVMGVWVWEALLTRDVLSTAHGLFRFMIRFVGMVVEWWLSVRRDVVATADFIIYIGCDLGAPPPNLIFDAQGANDLDDGGFGIVGAEVDRDLVLDCVVAGSKPKQTVVKLNVDVDRLLGKQKRIEANVPLSPLPKALFDGSTDWRVITSGRWQFADRIELGEGRAALRLMRILAASSGAHRSRITIL